MTEFKIGDRVLHLVLSMDAWERFETIYHKRIDQVILSLEGTDDLSSTLDIFAELARTGDELMGIEEPVTREWISRRVRPGALVAMAAAAVQAINEGLSVEGVDDKPEVVDLVLEEIKKKAETEAS